MQRKRQFLLLVVLCTLVLASTVSGVPNAAASSHIQSKWTTASEGDQALEAPPTPLPPSNPGGTPPDDNWDGAAPDGVAPGLGDGRATAASESLLFPATGDTINVQANPYWWHAGDYAQGVRTPGLNSVAAVKYDLTITQNVLSGAGHVDLELSINGVVVGSFTVLPGETSRSVSFFFPPISGPSYTIRLEETNTVASGAGSIVIPLDTSPLRLIPLTASDIDIKPGDPDNIIPYKSRGKTQVAILSSETFDAPSQVARLSLNFGRTGDEKSLSIHKKETAQCDVWDVSADGLADLVCAFLTEYAGFQPGDSEGVLKGETVDGVPFEARDSVRVVPK